MKLIFTSFFILVLSAAAAGQGYVDILPDEIKNPFIERSRMIELQLLEGSVNEWAGTYELHVGHTWQELLVWDPRVGFAAFRDTCSNGPRAWVNYGGASLRDNFLTLSPERKKDDDFVLDLPSTQFTLVRWGSDRWLVPSDKLALFAYAVNSRSGDHYTIAYSKRSDTDTPASGRPNLPPEYMRLLRLPPIRAKVVEIGREVEEWYPQMTIDAGKDKGVIEGMGFWLVGHKGITFRVRVVDVGDRSSVVEATEWGKSGPALMKEIVPTVGWRFSSRMH